MRGGMKVYAGSAAAARAYLEADRGRAGDPVVGHRRPPTLRGCIDALVDAHLNGPRDAPGRRARRDGENAWLRRSRRATTSG